MHWAAIRLTILGGDDERKLSNGHRRPNGAIEDFPHQPRRSLARFKHVYVRVRVISDDRIRSIPHPPRDVRMEIQRGDNRLIWAEHLARPDEHSPSTSSSPSAVCAPCIANRSASASAWLSAAENFRPPLEIRSYQAVGGDRPRGTDGRHLFAAHAVRR